MVCINVYMCVCICMDVCIYICLCVYTFMFIFMCMHICICVYIYTYICIYIYTVTYVHTHIRIYVYTYIGVVYKAIDLMTNKHVALKKIRVEIEDEGIPTTALREIVLLRQLEHPNVVKLENVVMDASRLYLVFELVDTDLKKYMDGVKGALSADLVQSYASQILEGLAYCHSMGMFLCIYIYIYIDIYICLYVYLCIIMYIYILEGLAYCHSMGRYVYLHMYIFIYL
jgi:hypothetical protein